MTSQDKYQVEYIPPEPQKIRDFVRYVCDNLKIELGNQYAEKECYGAFIKLVSAIMNAKIDCQNHRKE